MKEAVLLLAHGSRRSEANEEWKHIWQLFTERHPNLLMVGAFIEFAEPNLEDGVHLLIGQGAEKIYIVPLFLTVGNHLRQNIPERLQVLRESHPEVALELTEHLGVDPLLVQIIEQRLQEQGLELSR